MRVVRLSLPAHMIRRIDELVGRGIGGYESRAEFVREAVEQLLDVTGSTELGESDSLHAKDDPGIAHLTADSVLTPHQTEWQDENAASAHGAASPGLSTSRTKPRSLSSLADTKIDPPPQGFCFDDFDPELEVDDGPLFGLHNRDWVSLWAATQLCLMTSSGPVELGSFYELITDAAWRLAASLAPLERAGGFRLTVSLPTNFGKKQSAEEGFRAFAIGTVHRRREHRDRSHASGPLYAWKVAGLQRDRSKFQIAPLTQGYELLEALRGLSLELPHSHDHAAAFFTYVREYATGDWNAFRHLMSIAKEKPRRQQLLEHFRKLDPDWSDATVSTNAAGYVARAREWGLLEPRLKGGRYLPTETGLALFPADEAPAS
jgi:Arc/MetJ-type ribon-helix-helix transcriptional regulator